MMSPGAILALGLLCEIVVQVGKRATYWIGASKNVHYGFLVAGDVVFLVLFAAMLRAVTFTRKHWVVLSVFLVFVAYSISRSGFTPTLVAVRNTYLWVLFTVLFVLEPSARDKAEQAESLRGAATALGILLLLYAVVQVSTDYAFERPWFELSGTSLIYEGVTNFGEAAKAFSFLGGPTDFATYGLFALSIAVASRSRSIGFVGAAILLMSGTRGIIFGVPAWFAVRYLAPRKIVVALFLSLAASALVIVYFGEELVGYLIELSAGRFSLATMAPRILLWSSLEWKDLVLGGGLATNLAEVVTDAPTVIDSGLLYFVTELGLPASIVLVGLLLQRAQREVGPPDGALATFIGPLVIASIAQIPFYTRLFHFLACVIVYAGAHRAETQEPLVPDQARQEDVAP